MMRVKATIVVGLATLTVLGGCVEAPLGPSVAVMPGPNKPFDAFQTDQAVCRQFAEQQVGGAQAANQTGTNQTLVGAGVGTLVGAGLGAAIGAAAGNPGAGAAIGAGTGALGGTVVGSSQAQRTQLTLQQRFDIAYAQCMSSRGNQVPGFAPAPVSSAFAPPPPPPPRTQVSVGFSASNVAFGFSDGYWDRRHAWHSWPSHGTRRSWGARYPAHYFPHPHTRYRHGGWGNRWW